jgi:hypothetical protein
MAVITGNTGNVVVTVSFAAIIINVTEWTGSIENEFFDRRIFGGPTDFVQEYRGSYQMTGTITGFLDDTAVPVITNFNMGAAVSTFVLTASTAQTYGFDGHVHNFTPSVNRRTGLNAYTANFRSDTAIVFV